MEKPRTLTQNAALHVYFELLAEELNNAGLEMRKVLKPSVEIPWDQESVKSFLWKPIQFAQIQKDSTTDLTTAEVNKIYETLNRHLGDKLSVHVDFPTSEPELYA